MDLAAIQCNTGDHAGQILYGLHHLGKSQSLLGHPVPLYLGFREVQSLDATLPLLKHGPRLRQRLQTPELEKFRAEVTASYGQ